MILFQGKSQFNGKNLTVIATFNTRNAKTGSMIQTWILPTDNSILDKSDDKSTQCGNCPIKSACYVTLHQAPNQIQKTYFKGGYIKPTKKQLASKLVDESIRLGAYGDPAMVPFEVWETVLKYTKKHTGYTHQWRWGDTRFNSIVMASVESVEAKVEANAKGYKTFRVKQAHEPILTDEVLCPNQKNDDITCKLCGLCNGKKANVVIDIHGTKAKIANFKG